MQAVAAGRNSSRGSETDIGWGERQQDGVGGGGRRRWRQAAAAAPAAAGSIGRQRQQVTLAAKVARRTLVSGGKQQSGVDDSGASGSGRRQRRRAAGRTMAGGGTVPHLQCALLLRWPPRVGKGRSVWLCSPIRVCYLGGAGGLALLRLPTDLWALVPTHGAHKVLAASRNFTDRTSPERAKGHSLVCLTPNGPRQGSGTIAGSLARFHQGQARQG
jgi:hypothetical protein